MINPAVQQEIERGDEMRRAIQRINRWLLLVIAALVIGPILLSLSLARQYPVISTVGMDNVEMLSPAALCPGDPVIIRYDFHTKGAGILVRDRVLWRVTPPPKTMVFSTSRRLIITERIDQQLTEAWHVPARFVNPETDLEEALPPGDYRLIFSVSSPTNNTAIAIQSVDFAITADCE